MLKLGFVCVFFSLISLKNKTQNNPLYIEAGFFSSAELAYLCHLTIKICLSQKHL